MPTAGSGETEPTLEQLLRDARAAHPHERVNRFRDPIASRGTAGIEAIAPWLSDATLGRFAVAVVERAGRQHDRNAAVRALRAGRETADPKSVLPFINAALAKLDPGHPPQPGPDKYQLPRGLKVVPPFDVVHHIVRDRVVHPARPSRHIYLLACGRYFSGNWVDRHGGLLDPSGRAICYQCAQSVEPER